MQVFEGKLWIRLLLQCHWTPRVKSAQKHVQHRALTLICNCTNTLDALRHRRSTLFSEAIARFDNPVTCTLCGKSDSKSSEHQLSQKRTLTTLSLLCYIVSSALWLKTWPVKLSSSQFYTEEPASSPTNYAISKKDTLRWRKCTLSYALQKLDPLPRIPEMYTTTLPTTLPLLVFVSTLGRAREKKRATLSLG